MHLTATAVWKITGVPVLMHGVNVMWILKLLLPFITTLEVPLSMALTIVLGGWWHETVAASCCQVVVRE